MEIDTKLRANRHQVYFSENNNYPKLPLYLKNDTPSDVPFSSSSTYLQDFHHLDHQIQANGSSTNPMFGVQTQCFDTFDRFPYYNNSSNFDVYECKPFADNYNGGHGHVMDNFQSGGGYLNHHVMMGSDHQSQISYTYQEPLSFVVPDEASCVNNNNNIDKSYYRNRRFDKSRFHSKKTIKGGKKSNVVKGQWTIEEDRILIRLVEQYGIRKWSHIAQMLPGRIGKQCRERWHNHLRPDIKKDTWSEEEDKALIEAHAEIGNKWAEIAKRLPGRTENSIKNHWNATKRRQFSRRKCRTKYPRPSILQDYIKSLNLNLNSAPIKNQERLVSTNNTSVSDIKDKAAQSYYQTNPPATAALNGNANDRLVPEFEFHELADFDFDDKLFPESCSIETLSDEMMPIMVEDMEIEFDDNVYDETPFMVQVKQELDLVELISQANLP